VNASWIPWQLREALWSTLDWRERAAARRAFLSICRWSGEGIRTGFGGILDDGRPIHGGAVKLLPLREAFGAGDGPFNILYAVSSCQPRCAEQLFEKCRNEGIRIVWNQNGVAYPAWAGSESERFNRPMRRLREMADFVVNQSEFCEVSAKRFLGPCDKPSAILYNPVDLVAFSPLSGREGSDSGSVRLLAAGTHGTRDRVTCVLDALRELRAGGIDATLTVAGNFQWSGGEEDFVRESERLGIANSVQRTPRFSQSDAPALYRNHDLLLHPKYMDPCPTVVLEALACGLPVVGSMSGGMPELVPETCGTLIEAPLDWDIRHTPSGLQIADAVAALLPRLGEVSAAARRHAEARFAVGPWVGAHGTIFRSLPT